jgi:RNA polymerase sigma-70 factor (ECF subfamily)
VILAMLARSEDSTFARVGSLPTFDQGRAQRFHDAALPHLDAVYTLAHYLLRNSADAEDAVQECYLRAFRHFDGFRGAMIKPWLLAILRNVCRSEYARRAEFVDAEVVDSEGIVPLWVEGQDSPETEVLQRLETETMRRFVDALPDPYRETLVLRELNDLSYREIADVIGAPVGTVMSRLARARSLLRDAWIAAGNRRELA